MPIRVLTKEQEVAFAGELRAARADTVKNAEAYEEIIFAIERLGSFVTRSHGYLGKYKQHICKIVKDSALAKQASVDFPTLHLEFDVLYDSVLVGRNDAFHQGAVARQLAAHAQELALIVEDALMSRAQIATEFMVRDPLCAELWQPLSAIRRTMLLNAFSFLPYQASSPGPWKLISDFNVAVFTRSRSIDERKKRLLMTLEDAVKDGLKYSEPILCEPNDVVTTLALNAGTVPYLVVSSDNRLCGIITAFDFL